MSKEPEISVVMPVYNGESYLRPAINSILSQSFSDFELILVNDGSTDKSEEIILSYQDERIKYLKNGKNCGIIQTLNKGLDTSIGKYIIRMDADDISLPARFAKQFAFMEANPDVGVAGTAYYSFSKKGSKKIIAQSEPEVLKGFLLFNSSLCHPSVIIRKSVLSRNNIRYNESYKHAEDYDLWVQMSKVSKLTNLKDILLKYRSHDKQGTVVHNSVQKESAASIRRNFLQHLGFSFSDTEFATHTVVASNQLITSQETLAEIERWFINLMAQNVKIKAFAPTHFNYVLGKMWFDSCGITNLGLSAYRKFSRSPLAAFYPASKTKLFVKCVLRAFRK